MHQTYTALIADTKAARRRLGDLVIDCKGVQVLETAKEGINIYVRLRVPTEKAEIAEAILAPDDFKPYESEIKKMLEK